MTGDSVVVLGGFALIAVVSVVAALLVSLALRRFVALGITAGIFILVASGLLLAVYLQGQQVDALVVEWPRDEYACDVRWSDPWTGEERTGKVSCYSGASDFTGEYVPVRAYPFPFHGWATGRLGGTYSTLAGYLILAGCLSIPLGVSLFAILYRDPDYDSETADERTLTSDE